MPGSGVISVHVGQAGTQLGHAYLEMVAPQAGPGGSAFLEARAARPAPSAGVVKVWTEEQAALEVCGMIRAPLLLVR